MKPPKNLNLEEAVEFLKFELSRMEAQPKELEGMDPDEAFLSGYKIAIADLEACTRKQK